MALYVKCTNLPFFHLAGFILSRMFWIKERWVTVQGQIREIILFSLSVLFNVEKLDQTSITIKEERDMKLNLRRSFQKSERHRHSYL